MKKLMTMAAAAVLAVSLLGCAGESKPPAAPVTPPANNDKASSDTPPAEPAAPAGEEKK